VHHSLLLLVGNELLASSFLVSLLAAGLLVVLLLEPAVRRLPLPIRATVTLATCALLAVFLRTRLAALLGSQDDVSSLKSSGVCLGVVLRVET